MRVLIASLLLLPSLALAQVYPSPTYQGVTVRSNATIGTGLANYLQLYGYASGNGPVIKALGADADIDIWVSPKGSGNIRSYGGLRVGAATEPLMRNGILKIGGGGTLSSTVTGALSVSIGNMDGTLTSGNGFLNGISTGIDNVNGAATGGLANWYNGLSFGGSNTRGSRVADLTGVNMVATTANKSAGIRTYYNARTATANASANDGGTGPDAASAWGSLFGDNVLINLKSGATNWKNAHGSEIDIAVESGASVSSKIGLAITQSGNDRVQGTDADIALAFGNQASAGVPGWRNLIQIGGADGWYPIDPVNGRILWVDTASQPGGPARTALAGFDLRNITFSEAAFESIGFVVDGYGNTTINSAQLAVTTVAALPTCAAGLKGRMMAVSDATAPTYRGALTGGGAVAVPVFCDGSAWTAH